MSPHLEVKGRLTISCTGVVGSCGITNAGVETTTVNGTLEKREKQFPLLKIALQMDVGKHCIANSFSEEGEGIGMPIQLQNADIELNYWDGEVLELGILSWSVLLYLSSLSA